MGVNLGERHRWPVKRRLDLATYSIAQVCEKFWSEIDAGLFVAKSNHPVLSENDEYDMIRLRLTRIKRELNGLPSGWW